MRILSKMIVTRMFAFAIQRARRTGRVASLPRPPLSPSPIDHSPLAPYSLERRAVSFAVHESARLAVALCPATRRGDLTARPHRSAARPVPGVLCHAHHLLSVSSARCADCSGGMDQRPDHSAAAVRRHHVALGDRRGRGGSTCHPPHSTDRAPFAGTCSNCHDHNSLGGRTF